MPDMAMDKPQSNDRDALNLRDKSDLLKFVEPILREEAQISFKRHGTFVQLNSVDILAQKFAEIIAATTLPSPSLPERSKLFRELAKTTEQWLKDTGGERNLQMTHIWTDSVLEAIEGHPSIKT